MELEQDQIIPSGTQWSRPELKNDTVTTKVQVLSTDFEVLTQIALAARVHIQVPVGQHGEIRGSITVRASDPLHKIGAWGHHYRIPAP